MERALLDGQLLLHSDWDNPAPRINWLRRSPSHLGDFARKLVLYDKLIIPTVDFSILPVLVRWLSPDIFGHALRDGTVQFVRFKGSIGYAGAGHGLARYEIHPPDKHTYDDPKFAPVAEPDAALTTKFRDFLPDIESRRARRLRQQILDKTTLTDLADWHTKVKHEAYMDVLNSPFLRGLYSIRNTNMNKLLDLGDNELRIFNYRLLHTRQDEIDIVMALAAMNLETYLAEIAGAQDVASDPIVEPAVVAKVERLARDRDVALGFARILEVNRLPDLGDALAAGEIEFKKLYKARGSSAAGKFRRWFHEHVRDSPDEAAQEYVAALTEIGPLDRFPVKLIRFLVTTALGQIPGVGPAVGGVAGFADSFVVSWLLRKDDPKFLIDELRRAVKS